MSVAEPTAPEVTDEAPAPRVKRRPLRKRAMHLIRRGHLYFGLFLLPWAVLYGVTGFLFNHPTAFSDAPTRSFGADELTDTPMESVPTPQEVAAQVVAGLNARAKDGKPYTLVEPEKAKWTRDFAFATTKADGQEVSVLFDVTKPGGTIRSKTVAPPAKVEEPAPFAVGGAKGATKGKGGRGDKGAPKGGEKGVPKGDAPTGSRAADALALDAPLPERVKAAAPVVLERTGYPAGEITVTSVPDLSFQMSDGEKVWRVTYNGLAGTVSGSPADAAPPPEELSTRRFLTRLHLAHGFPGSQNAKWFWAVVVDAMAFVMVFWGVSGVLMWWQIKATRRLGFVVLLLSAGAATALGLGMHDLFTARP